MATSLSALRHNQTLAWNSLWQLEHDFLIYGKYNVGKLQDIVMTVNSLQNRKLSIERLLTGQDLQMLQVAHMTPDVIGRMTFIHKLNLYVHSMLERQIRLYEWLLCHLQDLLDSIGILSTDTCLQNCFLLQSCRMLLQMLFKWFTRLTLIMP